MSKTKSEVDPQAPVEPPPPKVRGLQLQDGEKIVMVARPSRLFSWPKYLVTLGLYGIWRKRDTRVLTDHRLLIGKGVVNRTERSIPLSRVEDADYVRRSARGFVDVVVNERGRRRTEHIGPLTTRTARRLAVEIQSRV